MSDQMLDFHHGELLNPMTGCASAYLRRDFVQMLGCDAELLGIIGYGSVRSVASPFEHLDEARHDVGRALCGLSMLEEGCMGIHGIEIEHSHTLQDGLPSVGFRRMFGAEQDILKVMLQEGECFTLQLEDGMHEEMQPAASSVAAVRHTGSLLLGRKKKSVKLAILRWLDTPNMACHSYHAATGLERMLVP